MIHTLLNLQRPLIVLDTETTGLDVQKDRVVELAFQLFQPDGDVKEWRSLINPGVPIPPAATRIHGITDGMVQECRNCRASMVDLVALCKCEDPKGWPYFKQIAPRLAKGFSNCDFAGQNPRFDLRILAAEFARAGVEWSYAGARIVDSGQLERLAVPRSLSHLHEKYVGLKHDGAHGALSDVRAAATVIMKQLEAYDALPRDIGKLHELQWPGELDEGGRFRLVGGVAICQFGKHRGVPMHDIPVDYFDWIIANDFPADVKALARDAKLGKFPEVKK